MHGSDFKQRELFSSQELLLVMVLNPTVSTMCVYVHPIDTHPKVFIG